MTLDRGSGGRGVLRGRLRIDAFPSEGAGKRERVVPHRADVMLGLPDTPALDARACVERVDDGGVMRTPHRRVFS